MPMKITMANGNMTCENMTSENMACGNMTGGNGSEDESKMEVNKISATEIVKMTKKTKEIGVKPDGTVFSVYTDIVEKDDDDVAVGQALDIRFDIDSMPKWDGGHQTTKGFEPTLRQFVQRIEDIASVKGWNETEKLVMLPNMLHDGIKHAYDR